MAGANTMCMSCGERPADTLCFCVFPLVHLCSSDCLTKHRQIPRFHYELPTTYDNYVVKENFSECQDWLFRLSRAQQSLKDNLTALDAFQKELEANFLVIDREIQTIKEEYRQEIQSIRTKLSEMIESAVAETTKTALHPSAESEAPLTQWIWWRTQPAHHLDEQLYRMNMQVREKEEFRRLVCVKMEPLTNFIPKFGLSAPVPECVLSISPPFQVNCLSSVAVIPHMKPTHCQVCHSAFTLSDVDYHCPGQCRCKHCLIEAFTDRNVATCKYCSAKISSGVLALVSRDWRRCHVCEIAVRVSETERNALCVICRKCVQVAVKGKLLWKVKKGRCPLCKDSGWFDINEEMYEKKEEVGACCGRTSTADRKLPCGHYVCPVHTENLRRCRSCQTPVKAAVAQFTDLLQ